MRRHRAVTHVGARPRPSSAQHGARVALSCGAMAWPSVVRHCNGAADLRRATHRCASAWYRAVARGCAARRRRNVQRSNGAAPPSCPQLGTATAEPGPAERRRRYVIQRGAMATPRIAARRHRTAEPGSAGQGSGDAARASALLHPAAAVDCSAPPSDGEAQHRRASCGAAGLWRCRATLRAAPAGQSRARPRRSSAERRHGNATLGPSRQRVGKVTHGSARLRQGRSVRRSPLLGDGEAPLGLPTAQHRIPQQRAGEAPLGRAMAALRLAPQRHRRPRPGPASRGQGAATSCTVLQGQSGAAPRSAPAQHRGPRLSGGAVAPGAPRRGHGTAMRCLAAARCGLVARGHRSVWLRGAAAVPRVSWRGDG
jgi:hypothetical protein